MTDQPESTTSKPQLPPLPEVPYEHSIFFDEGLMRQVIKYVYDNHPDIIYVTSSRELNIANNIYNEEERIAIEDKFQDYMNKLFIIIKDHFKLESNGVVISLMFEVRRTARAMVGLDH
ncbi:MAG: hypothetical protein IPI58_01900 [Alphaproteobacteria bacterium]|nr:MAG: hypothetical protein IPI58_01900 [Alphaproteobacteria bacterium]